MLFYTLESPHKLEAIFRDADVPAKWSGYIQLNADRVKVLKPTGARVTEKLSR